MRLRDLEVLDRLRTAAAGAAAGSGAAGAAAAGAAAAGGVLPLSADGAAPSPREQPELLALSLERVAAELRLRIRLEAIRFVVDRRTLDFLLGFVRAALPAPPPAAPPPRACPPPPPPLVPAPAVMSSSRWPTYAR